MGELLTRQTGKELSSELRKKFSEVQHIKEVGRIAIYGIDKKTKKKHRIGTKEYIKESGYNPSPQKASGIWSSGGGEIPVTIVGTHGKRKGGVEYLRAYRKKEEIPRNEIKWLGESGDSNGNLEDQLLGLSDRLQKMEKNWKQLEERNRQLKTENSELKARLDRLTSGYIPFEPVINNRYSRSKSKSYLNRSAGWVGSKMPRRGEPNYTNRQIEEREDGPVIVATEERVDGYRVEDRRRGAAAVLGAAAAIGLGVLVAGLWGEHEENENHHRPSPITLPSTPHVWHDSTAGLGNRHEVLFHDNKAFKISLPGNLDWHENANGSYRIDDASGHTVVPHVYSDEQGNLDKDSRKLLRTDPYHSFKLKQRTYEYHTLGTDYNTRYETVVENQ